MYYFLIFNFKVVFAFCINHLKIYSINYANLHFWSNSRK